MARIKGSLSPEMRDALAAAHNEARQRVIERGTVHFRLTPESMSKLMKVSDKYRKPYGTMCREWAEYHLELELQTPGDAVNVFTSSGKTMVCALHPESRKAETIYTPIDVTMAADCGCVFRRGLRASAWVRLVVGEGFQKPYAEAG